MDSALSSLPRAGLIALGETGYWITREALRSEALFLQQVRALQAQRSDLDFPPQWLEEQKQLLVAQTGNSRIDPVEREDQLETIFASMERAALLTVITGPPAATKSTLAALWVKLARLRYPDLPVILTAQEEPALQRLHDKFGEPDCKKWVMERALKLNWPQQAVIVVDEAGLFGTDTMIRFFRRALESGARKILLIGDDRQLVSAAAGQPFRWLCEQDTTDIIQSTHSFRQKNLWLREAVRCLYQNRIDEALRLIPLHFTPREAMIETAQHLLREADPAAALLLVHGDKDDCAMIRDAFPDYRVLSLPEAQGLAVDRAVLFMLHKSNMAEWLVGCSRQRHDLDVVIDRNVYRDARDLAARIDPYPRQLMAMDLVAPDIILDIIDKA